MSWDVGSPIQVAEVPVGSAGISDITADGKDAHRLRRRNRTGGYEYL